MKSAKQLSLCLVIRNNEKYLTDYLPEISQFVDEIIIADLGSTDQSVDIARKSEAKVYQTEWDNDYSRVKNLCLDQAEGRWILFLEPDERISGEQLKSIKQLLINPNAEGYLLYIDQDPQQYRIISPVQNLRLFRNRKEYRYRYKAFEVIPDDLISNLRDSAARIHRYADPDKDHDAERFRILQKELEQQPEDSYLQYLYGIELLNRNQPADSLPYFMDSYKKVNLEYLFAPHLYKCFAWAYIALEQYREALDILDQGFRYFPLYSDFLVLRGDIRKRQGRYNEAMEDLENSLRIWGLPDEKVPSPEIAPPVICESLGELHELLLNQRKALDCYRLVLDSNRQNYNLLYQIGELASELNCTEMLDSLFHDAEVRKDPDQMMILLDILYQNHQYDKVLTSNNALEPFLEKDQMGSIIISCFLMLGKFAEADFLLEDMNQETEFYREALLERIERDWSLGLWQQAEQRLEQVDQIEGIEKAQKELYHQVHRILAENETCCISMKPQECETLSSLLRKFLWLDQLEKAKLLQTVLLNNEVNDDQLIQLALLWAKRGGLSEIQKIYSKISEKEKKKELKEKIIDELLYGEYIEEACEMAKLDSIETGALEYVLWSKNLEKEIKKWIGNLPLRKIEEDDRDSTSCAEAHFKIGMIYEKTGRTKEALIAYLRSLQWDPVNHSAQNKIKELFDRDNEYFDIISHKDNWYLEGSYFHDKAVFQRFVQGMLHFKNQHYWKALESFADMASNEENLALALSYEILCLWIADRKIEAENLLDQHRKLSEMDFYLSRIGKVCLLEKISEGEQKFPYTEIIKAEKQRIINLFVTV